MRGKHPRAAVADADLAEILLRLPTPATLACAALVCRRWCRVAFAPAFLRRFRRLHPPPLLGFFVCNGGRPYQPHGGLLHGEILARGPLPVLDPTFVPAVSPPPGVGGAIGRCRDFSLSSLPDVDHWALADAHDGLLLLCSTCERSQSDEVLGHREIPQHFAVCNPLSGRSAVLPKPKHDDDDGLYGGFYICASLVTSHNDDKSGIFSFEVLLVTYFSEPSLYAFSSSTGEWAEVPCPADDYVYVIDDTMPLVDDGARANGCMYWLVHYWGWQCEEEHLLVLDTRTKEFSTMNLPWRKRARYDRNIRVMRSDDDGELRLGH